MANKQEIDEIKATLQKLESQIEQISNESKRRRSGWQNFAIGFVIVFVVLLISIGVIQFLSAS